MTQSFEVEKKENEHFYDLFSNIYYSHDTHDYVSLLWGSDYEWKVLTRSFEYSDYQSCSMNYSNWIESFSFLGKERTSLREKIKFHLNFYEVAINKLFKCCNGSYTAKKEFEISTKEWFMNIKYEDAELNKYIVNPLWQGVGSSIYVYDSSWRLCKLLCISRIFLNQDKEIQFTFVCSLAETVMKYQSEEMLLRTIEYYLKIQLLKNPLCTFDNLSTGISDLQFEHQLRFCYSKRMLCENQGNATDQSIEENLKDFILSFDEVTENIVLDYRAKLNIFNSLIHILNKFIEQDHAANIKLTIEVLQKIIKNFFIVYCFKIFGQDSLFRSWRSLKTNGQHFFDFNSLTTPKENLLRDVFSYIMKFQHNLKLIPKNLQTEMMVATIIEENKCMCSCLLKTLRYMPSSRPFETVDEFSNELTFSYLHMHYRTKNILPIFIDTIVDYSAVKGFVNVIKEFCDMKVMTPGNTEIILECICDIANIRFHKKPHELAKVILDINLNQSKGDLLIKITHILWDLLKIREKRKSQNNIKTHQNKKGSKLQQILAEGDRPLFFRSKTRKENEQKRRDINNENMREIKPILYHCLCILRNAKKKEQITDVKISNYINGFKFDEQSLENEDQAGKKSNTEIMLIIMLLLLVAATRHHKSAKLKKYLSQKYEYKEAILYILWCSGDIHINPGPPMKKSRLLHDSQRERAWIQDLSSILLKLYKGKPPHSKPKHLWREKPDDWPSNKPFYDTKNHPHDESGCFVSDSDLLECLIQCCDCKKVYINNVYRNEIAAWRENRNQLLYKLYTFRTETEKIKMVLQNFTIYKDNDELNEALNNINVKLCLKIGDSDLNNDPTKRLKNQSEMIADTTRYLSAVVCKIIKGKDPESKCDGIWTAPPEQWPTNVPFFSPFNRGKCKYTCSDQLLLSTLLQHPKAVIPPKFKSLVEAFQTVVNATDKKEAKKHREVLCRVKTIQTEVSVLDYALTYLHSEGFFTPEIYHSLRQWWTHENVENQTEITFANLQRVSEDRPKIRIEVTRKCVMLSVNMDYPAKSLVCYSISLDDSLPTTLDSNSQHCSDVEQLFNDDNSQGACVNKNLQIPHKQKSNSDAASLNESNYGTDTTQYSIINNDNETDSSKTNEPYTRNKLLPVESNSLSLSELEKSKENATSTKHAKFTSISNREETLARDSDGTNHTTNASGINPIQTGQCDNRQRAIVSETNESEVLIEKQSKGKKRKLSNEDNDNGMKKPLLMGSDIKNDSVHKKTGEETVSDHQFDIDFLLEGCIDDISFQHDKSTSELSKNNSSLGSAEDEIMDTSFTDYDEVSDGLELLLDDLINYESGKTSRLEKELLLDS
ncbi:uncharacterized protein [Mytilus edulis]|uniref:uncharacterized protein n=1 Tax=Mytilus edulis TaxID=6550 RepID=UPI0039F13636